MSSLHYLVYFALFLTVLEKISQCCGAKTPPNTQPKSYQLQSESAGEEREVIDSFFFWVLWLLLFFFSFSLSGESVKTFQPRSMGGDAFR